MALHLLEIYDVIAGLTVSNGTVNVPIKDLHEVERAYPDANCPVCLLLQSDDDAPGDFTPIALDSSGMVAWNISVLYLQKPAEQGTGWKQHAVAVATFTQNFIQAVVNAKSSFCSYGMLEGLSARRGVWEYPAGSTQQFYGTFFTFRFRDFTRIS